MLFAKPKPYLYLPVADQAAVHAGQSTSQDVAQSALEIRAAASADCTSEHTALNISFCNRHNKESCHQTPSKYEP